MKTVYNKMRLNCPESYENLEAHFPLFSVFNGSKLIFRHYFIQNVKDRIHIRVHKIDKESVSPYSQFAKVKEVKKILRIS